MKKMIVALGCSLVLLAGCAPQPKSGKVVPVGIDDVFTKMDKKESFVLMLSRDGCEYCVLMHKMLKDTIEDHDTIIYNINMDDSTNDKLLADVAKLEKRFNKPGTTPHVYSIVDGKVKDDLVGFDENEPMQFWNWIKDNNLEKSK